MSGPHSPISGWTRGGVRPFRFRLEKMRFQTALNRAQTERGRDSVVMPDTTATLARVRAALLDSVIEGRMLGGDLADLGEVAAQIAPDAGRGTTGHRQHRTTEVAAAVATDPGGGVE